jgi:ribokinase
VQDHAWHVDHFAAAGETRRAYAFTTGPGGKGFNQAVACHRQGAATVFMGAIGHDPLGEVAQRFAAAEGLSCRWLIRHDRPTAASSIVVDSRGENQIAVALGANEFFDPAFVRDAEPEFVGAKVLLAQLENNLDAVDAALRMAKKHKLVRILNPAPVHPKLERQLLADVDICTPNETEFSQLLRRMTGIKSEPTAISGIANESLHKLARELEIPTVVVTMGKAGCFVSHGDDRRGDELPYYRIDAEQVKVRDTTGAGDAFSGGLAAGLVLFPGAPFERAVRHGSRVAALSVEEIGTAPAMPVRREVETRFGK